MMQNISKVNKQTKKPQKGCFFSPSSAAAQYVCTHRKYYIQSSMYVCSTTQRSSFLFLRSRQRASRFLLLNFNIFSHVYKNSFWCLCYGSVKLMMRVKFTTFTSLFRFLYCVAAAVTTKFVVVILNSQSYLPWPPLNPGAIIQSDWVGFKTLLLPMLFGDGLVRAHIQFWIINTYD